MDRKKQIAALTDDEGERLLLAQACERLTRAEQRGIPAAQPGDLYLLCSDGLSEMVSDADICTVLLQKNAISEKATLLVSMANDNGGRDNVSVILAKAETAS